jgi:hypothetical protein
LDLNDLDLDDLDLDDIDADDLLLDSDESVSKKSVFRPTKAVFKKPVVPVFSARKAKRAGSATSKKKAKLAGSAKSKKKAKKRAPKKAKKKSKKRAPKKAKKKSKGVKKSKKMEERKKRILKDYRKRVRKEGPLNCKNNEFIQVFWSWKLLKFMFKCQVCKNEKNVVPYGDFEPLLSNVCFSCPFTLDPSTNICVTSYQDKVLRGQVSLPDPNVNGGRVDLSPVTPFEATQQFSSPNFVQAKGTIFCESQLVAVFSELKAVEASTPTSVNASTPTAVNASTPTADEASSPTPAKASSPTADEASSPTPVKASTPTANEASSPNADEASSPTPAKASTPTSVKASTPAADERAFLLPPLPVALQMTSCATGLTCCLPGFYGASSASCTECPSDKPSSPFSAPNSNCQCPNSASNKCFACNNKCRPYDSVSRMCVPYQCPSGQTCKVQSGAATCV